MKQQIFIYMTNMDGSLPTYLRVLIERGLIIQQVVPVRYNDFHVLNEATIITTKQNAKTSNPPNIGD